MSAFHNLPTLQKDEPENQWFHDWISAFGFVPITSYPTVRVGINQIDVWMIPHEWDIATKGSADPGCAKQSTYFCDLPPCCVCLKIDKCYNCPLPYAL